MFKASACVILFAFSVLSGSQPIDKQGTLFVIYALMKNPDGRRIVSGSRDEPERDPADL